MKKKGESGGSGEVPKKKEQKIVYIDDGSTVADMSGTRKGPPRRKSTMKEKWKTYITTVKHMILPLLITLLAMTMVFIILMLVTGKWT